MAKYRDCIIELNYDDVDIISFVESFEKKSVADKRIKTMIDIVRNKEKIQKIYKVPSNYSLPEVEYPIKKRLNLPEEQSEFINSIVKELQGSFKRSRGDIVKGIIEEFLDTDANPKLDTTLSEYIRNRCKVANISVISPESTDNHIGYIKQVENIKPNQTISQPLIEKNKNNFSKLDGYPEAGKDSLDMAMHKIKNSSANKTVEIKKTGQTENQVNFRKKFGLNNK